MTSSIVNAVCLVQQYWPSFYYSYLWFCGLAWKPVQPAP